VQDIFGEGNEVVVRLVVSGTQTGDLLGISASGRAVSWEAVDVYQLKNGKIRQEWAAEDLTAILNDTGTYKAPWIP
jgi:predicted ester cyclase